MRKVNLDTPCLFASPVLLTCHNISQTQAKHQWALSSRTTASPERYPPLLCVSRLTSPHRLTLPTCSPSRSHSCRLPTPCLLNLMLMREEIHRNSQPLPRDAPPDGEGLSYASFVVRKSVSA